MSVVAPYSKAPTSGTPLAAGTWRFKKSRTWLVGSPASMAGLPAMRSKSAAAVPATLTTPGSWFAVLMTRFELWVMAEAITSPKEVTPSRMMRLFVMSTSPGSKEPPEVPEENPSKIVVTMPAL